MSDHVSAHAMLVAQADAICVVSGAIEHRAPEELRAASGHARKHSKKQISQIAASIQEFGFTHPVLVTPEDEIICGHARVEAAKLLELATIPALCLADLTEMQVRAYRIADNKLAEGAEWDLSLLGEELRAIVEECSIEIVETLGFDLPEAEILIDGEDAKQEDDPDDVVSEVKGPVVTRSGDLWGLGDHRIYCGNCLEPESWTVLMQGDVAQVGFVDPPYNVPIAGNVSGLGKTKHTEFAMASGEMSSKEFIAFNAKWLAQMTGHMVNGAVFAVCMDWRSNFELESAVHGLGLARLNLCIWNKTNAGMGSLYRSKHEDVHILKVGDAPHINNVQLGRYGRYRTNVWDYAGANSFSKSRMDDLADHPTVKPVAMVADFLRDVSHRGHIVVDPFLGSGSTLLAAERIGRIARGIEIETVFLDVAIRRWEEKTGKEATLVGDGRSFSEVAAERLARDAA